MTDWKNLRYLQQGNLRQQRAYRVLEEFALWATLSGFDPVLASTIPLAIDLPASDLDIICEVALPRQALFEQLLRDYYGHLSGFQLGHTSSRGQEAIVGGFRYAGVAIEVFGQALPTSQQYACRSLTTFKRDFKKAFQLSPQRWLTQKRLALAHYQLTEKSRKPVELYLEVGFENLAHFSFAFKKQFGYPPSALVGARAAPRPVAG